MKEKRNLHLKVQEMCDCYATGDPLKEMSVVKNDEDKDDAAVKWLALAALHGVNNNAEEINIIRSSEGNVRVVAEYRDTELPSPGPEVGGKIMNALREITHIEETKGKTPLSLGIRNDSVNLKIKFKEKNGKEKITIKFPG
jgi:TPR repeat protein